MSDPISRLNSALEGHYSIERRLGEGGMASVYLARDEKHNRHVALKVLKPELAAVVGAERFLSEIETTANLQHPHVLPLYDSGQADGLLYYVMPYLEGESLRERLEREHQLPVDEAVQIAKNVAEALDYAHRHGVIHRDIKPANILLQDGKPVVSDFGIALAVSAGGAGRLTETGLSLGTPHYMSPEQATGDLNVGAASDIYALGCVLYEMLVGEPPYTGSTPQAILGKIVTGEADSVTKHRRSVPAHVDATVRKALEKVPADRFGSAQAFVAALGDPAFRHGTPSTIGAAAGSARSGWAAWAGWAAAIAFGLLLAWTTTRPAPAPRLARFELGLPQNLTASAGLDIDGEGRRIAFAASDASGATRLYLRTVDALVPTPIPGTEGGSRVRFSPDGRAVAFIVETSLRTVALDGTPPQTLVADSVFPVAELGWADDGTIYFGKLDGGLWRVGEGGEDPAEIVPASAEWTAWNPTPLPGGRAVLVRAVPSVRVAGDYVGVLSTETREVVPLFEGSVPRYATSRHILYTSGDWAGTLLAVPFDPERLEVTGPARTLTEGLSVDVNGNSRLAVSGTGSLVYQLGRSGPGEGQVVWVERGGSEEVVDPELGGAIETVAISPDGRRIAFDRGDGRRRDLWVYSLDDRTSARLTFEGEVNIRAAWTPDGREVGFVRRGGGTQAFFSRPWDGSAPARLLRAPLGESIIWEGHWTPDMRWLLYRELPRSGVAYLRYAAPHPDSAYLPILESEFFNTAMSLSPDGRWVAYQSNQSGRDEVYVRPFPGPGGQMIVSDGGGRGPIWRGGSIFYAADEGWFEAAVRTDPSFAVESRTFFAPADGYLRERTIARYDVSQDGQRILAIRDLTDAPTRIVHVQGFFEELRRLAPN